MRNELSRMTVGQLRQKYLEVFGEESRSNHKQFLFRRIAWRIQAIFDAWLIEIYDLRDAFELWRMACEGDNKGNRVYGELQCDEYSAL